MITDNFDRDSLGPNWQTPGRYGEIFGWTEGTEDDTVVIHAPGDVRQNPDRLEVVGAGSYIGVGEFTDADQWAEITILDPLERIENLVQYNAEWGYYAVYLNADPLADTSERWVGFRLWNAYSYLTSPSYYGPFYIDIITIDTAGDASTTDYLYLTSWELFGFNDGETSLPSGTKMRLEKVGDSYYGYIYNPKRKVWSLILGPVVNDVLAADGYPGFALSTGFVGPQDQSRISQFRAGAAGDTFLTSNSKVADAGMARPLVRGLTR